MVVEPVGEFDQNLPGVVTGDDRKSVFGDREEAAVKTDLLAKCKDQPGNTFRCPMCGRSVPKSAIVVDHVNENHAQTTASNLRCICPTCNSAKTHNTMALYRANGGVPMTETDGMYMQ